MSVKIVVDLTTQNGKHMITLPLSQNMLDKHLVSMKIYTGDKNEYKITGRTSGFDGLDKYIASGEDIEELNFLAQLLDGLSEKELETYEKFLSSCTVDITMQYLINVANNFLGYSCELYDGKFLPEYDYESGYFMKVKLSLPNQASGVYVSLPARQSVINRALHRLGVDSVDECTVSKCSQKAFRSIKQLIM